MKISKKQEKENILNMVYICKCIMNKKYNIDIDVVINNRTNLDGYLEFCRNKENPQEIDKFVVIGIKIIRNGVLQSIVRIIDTIAHEYAHIKFPNCHNVRIKKYEVKKEKSLHIKETKINYEILIKELYERGVIKVITTKQNTQKLIAV